MNISTKSNFLEKKRQEKKKTQGKIQSQTKVYLLQKNIRAFLARKQIQQSAYSQTNVRKMIFMGSDLSKLPFQVLDSFISSLQYQSGTSTSILKKLILSCLKYQDSQLFDLGLRVTKAHIQQVSSIFETKQFVNNLQRLLQKQQGYELLDISWAFISKSNFPRSIPSELLFEVVLNCFGNEMIGEGIYNRSIGYATILGIFAHLANIKCQKNISLGEFVSLGLLFAYCLDLWKKQEHKFVDFLNGFQFLMEMLRISLKKLFQEVITGIMRKQKLKNLSSLIEDEQELEYFENRIRSEPQFQSFTQITLQTIQKIFHHTEPLHLLMNSSQKLRQNMGAFVSEILFIYDDRKILFLYNFLSNEASIKELSKQKKQEFYSALNMKMLTIDDEQFLQFDIFDDKDWREIIQVGIARAFDIAKKMLVIGGKKEKIDIKSRMFKKQDEVETELKLLSNLLNNLNKKSLRTGKIHEEYFINEDLDKFLNTFKFGIGARAIEIMLKHFPFAFRFESRIKKLRQFIKADKLNHDRSLFLQEEVDPDLIVTVRRGHEFLDAYDACEFKDLRKKYKIVFFNEQGLEEEGIDGGGIIKEFINRVLKSSFSQIYGMFYETPQNQILPNFQSEMTREYEFVGKIVGKAVYQNINIDQKFAEPFLNLLIGRKNSFEDLQYIDKQVYKSMLAIRKMSNQDLESMQQTFTILDTAPSGTKNVVNLRNLSLGGQAPETTVNSENRVEFVLSYADFKCNKQLEEKTRMFRRGFLTVMKSEWLTMFSNEELNLIISGSSPNYSVLELKNSVLYKDYNEKSQTIIDLWVVLSEFTPEQKSAFLYYVTSCSRPPTMGFASMKPLICIQKSNQTSYLPTANTCMNVLRLPDYKNRQVLKTKLLYAINAKAGFEFA